MAIAAPLMEDNKPFPFFRLTEVGKVWMELRKATPYMEEDKIVRAYINPEIFFTPHSAYEELLHTDELIELAAQYEHSTLSERRYYHFLHIFSNLDVGDLAPSPYAIVSHEGPVRAKGDLKFLTRQYSVYARDERFTRSHEPIVTADTLKGVVDVMAPVFELDIDIGRCKADFGVDLIKDSSTFRDTIILDGPHKSFAFPIPKGGGF